MPRLAGDDPHRTWFGSHRRNKLCMSQTPNLASPMWIQLPSALVSTCIAGIAAVVVGSTTSVAQGTFSSAAPLCILDMPCTLEGTLHIMAPGYSGGGARLETASGCITLLLPLESDYFVPRYSWNGANVRVSGVAHESPETRLTDGSIALGWRYRDRGTQAGVCRDSPLFIYVDQVTRVEG
jgi:hypothetical protein